MHDMISPDTESNRNVEEEKEEEEEEDKEADEEDHEIDICNVVRQKTLPVMIHHNKFVKKLQRGEKDSWQKILGMIGSVVNGLYRFMRAFRTKRRDLSEPAPNQERYELAAQYLTRLLHADESRVETLTLIGTCLSMMHKCERHLDALNCALQPYFDHAMLNICIRDAYGTMWMLQFGIYYRAVVGHFCMPYKKELNEIRKNMNRYLKALRNDYGRMKRKVTLPDEWGCNPFDKTYFYLTDDFPWEKLKLYGVEPKKRKLTASEIQERNIFSRR